MVRSPDSSKSSQINAIFEGKDKPDGLSRRYYFDWLNHMSVARSAVGRHRLLMV